MADAHLNIRLRPTRIGFLVNPTDLASVREIMRACTCLWGGIYNPIIPVFRSPPKEWRNSSYERVVGYEVARGYIRFFEPDVFVEATPGLADKAGLSQLRERPGYQSAIVTLAEFLTPLEHRDWAEPAFGLSINNVFRKLYETEQRFVLRDTRASVLVHPAKSDGVAEAIFGVYPSKASVDYFVKEYEIVFKPNRIQPSPDAWKMVFEKNAETPLRITRHGTDIERSWRDDVVIFVFDHTKSVDLIDLWNLRLEPKPVLPVPLEWFDAVSDGVFAAIEDTYRPIAGSGSGMMHRATMEFARSIAERDEQAVLEKLKLRAGKAKIYWKRWRTRIWAGYEDPSSFRDRRALVTSSQQRTTATIEFGRERTVSLKAMSPPFDAKFGGHKYRWVNTIDLSVYGRTDVATVFPLNQFDRGWPPLRFIMGQMHVSREGWVLPQEFENSSETISLISPEEAIIGTLKRYGIDAQLSDPGHIAKQMLEHLSGLWGTVILADIDTLQLLNKMAGGLRRKTNGTDTVEEQFDRKSVGQSEWLALIGRRKAKNRWSRLTIGNFTDHNIIRLGLETECPNCMATNWHSLAQVDYDVTCERCLKTYPFPQSKLRDRNRNWAYRVVGPFSVPDYGRGAYGVLLTLRALDAINATNHQQTFSTALDLKIGSERAEIDFAVLRQQEGGLKYGAEPQLIIGEAKSFGHGDLIRASDLAKLKLVASNLPGALVVISVLRDTFTSSEVRRLRSFVQWGRRPNEHGRPSNPVILMTGVELFAEQYITHAWQQRPEPHKNFADFTFSRTLQDFADATQQIYLGMEPYDDWIRSVFEKRRARYSANSESK